MGLEEGMNKGRLFGSKLGGGFRKKGATGREDMEQMHRPFSATEW